MSLNKIMVVIDPTTEKQPAFERALESGRMTAAILHLYLCACEESGQENLEAAQQQWQPLLQERAAQAQAAGVESSWEIDWASDWRNQTVSAAARCGASMVFKNSEDHSQVQREIRDTSDWTLMRLAPCPVLLVKNFHDWQHRRVLAAVNPLSTDPAHIKLNHQIISFAHNFSEAYGSDAHFVTAFHDLNNPPEIAEVARYCGASEDHIHLSHGSAPDVIGDTARELNVDLIIIGTVGRDGIKGMVVGNTSEKLLDHTDSDLLILN